MANSSSAEGLPTEESTPEINQIVSNALLVSSEKEKIKVRARYFLPKLEYPRRTPRGAKSFGKSTGKEENPCNLSSLAHLPPSKGLVFEDLSSKVTKSPRWQPLK